METTQQKLDRLNALGGNLTDWEFGFAASVLDQYKRRNLSDHQHAIVDKILAKHDPAAVKARSDWRDSFDEEKQALARQAAEYYTVNPPYFGDVARKILNDPAYIPTEKCFVKMTQNKYVQRWIKERARGASFAKGQLVRFRRNRLVGQYVGSRFKGTLAVVCNVGDQVSATKGSRSYQVLPIGKVKPITAEERFLMRSKTA